MHPFTHKCFVLRDIAGFIEKMPAAGYVKEYDAIICLLFPIDSRRNIDVHNIYNALIDCKDLKVHEQIAELL